MADQENVGVYNLTKATIMSFPALFTPRRIKVKGRETGEPRYEANFIFSPQSVDWLALKALAIKLAKAKWPDVDLATLNWPFKNGTKAADKRKAAGKSDGEFQRDMGILVARSKFQPKLGVIDNGTLVELEDDAQKAKYKGKFYSGVVAFASVNLVAYDRVGDGNKDGVTAYLNQVLSTGQGKKLGGDGGGSLASNFSQYLGQVVTEDPTAGDDEIPF